MGHYDNVKGLNVGRSVFDLSYSKLLTCDFGQLIPVMVDEVYPGDRWDIGHQMVVRMNPLVSPVMHEINASIHTFFIPNRLVYDKWEDTITGGVDGKYDEDANPLPRWEPTDTEVGSLWDYFGFPVGVDPDGAYPLDFPKRGYNKIWNEFYRDINTMAEIDIETSEDVLKRCWQKDYFASALPFQQRGDDLAVPLSGIIHPDFTPAVDGTAATDTVRVAAGNTIQGGASGTLNAALILALNKANIDMEDAGTFDVNDLRNIFAMQKWHERNARCGPRYTEQLKAHYGVSNGDDRLQRPEYIGGVKFPVVVSEVLQTSSTVAGSPQGNMAGHGLTAGSGRDGSYRVTEHGWIISILSIMPVPMYSQGIDRQFLRRSRYDYYFPEFQNLSEQAIERAEIFANGTPADNQAVFGYQGRYDELRTKRNLVCGLFRTDLDHWHLGREFASYPELNGDFLEMDATTSGALNPYKRIFAVPSEPGFIVHVANIIKAARPISISHEPGLIDHM